MLFSGKIIALAGSLLFGVPEANVKKAKEDFAAIDRVFSSEKFSVEMTYYFYEEQVSSKPVDTKTGVFYRWKQSDYSKLMDIETLHTPELTITSNVEEKIMIVNGPVNKLSKPSIGVDTLLRLCKDIIITDLPDKTRKYELVFHSSQDFKKLEMVFDPETYRLKKITMLFWQQDKVLEDGEVQKINPKMEILYGNYDKTDVTKLEVFSSSKYVTKIGENKYKTAGKYSSYTIYNQKLK